MNIECVYEENIKIGDEIYYQCFIKDQVIPNDAKLNFIGDHKNGKTNDGVTCIVFYYCTVTTVPKGLTHIFPNLKFFDIYNSKLNSLNKEDLSEYRKIERFTFKNNELEFLPGDLFEGFENLEWILFPGNKLKVVEPNILDGHNNLKVVMFDNNPNFNRRFSINPVYNVTHSLEEVKDELFKNFFNSDAHFIKNYLEKLEFSAPKGLLSDVKAFIDDENSKDFKILIEDHEFLVHKMVLAVRSPVLAEIFRNNPEATNLKLNDIPVDIFEIILKFLYTDELPGEDETNFMQLFVAANRLQIKELKKYAAGKILSQINEENAIDIFNMSNKYDQNKLRQKSFEEVKKKYPKIEFKDEWAANPEKVTKVIEGFKKMVEGIKKLENGFNSLMTEN